MSILPDTKYVHHDYSVRKLENDYQVSSEAHWTQSEMGPSQNFIDHLSSILPDSNRETMRVFSFPKNRVIWIRSSSHQLFKLCVFSRIWNKHSWANSLLRKCPRFHSWVCISEKNKNTNLKIYTHPSIQSSTIYNSQDVETTKMSIDRKMDKEDVVGTSLVVHWWRYHASTAWDMCLFPSQGIEMLHATQHGQKIETKRRYSVYAYIYIYIYYGYSIK